MSRTPAPAAERPSSVDAALPRRGALAWAWYDWANSAFAMTVMAAFFPLLLKKYWGAEVEPTTTTFQLGVVNSASSMLLAVLAPVLGAMADYGRRKKRWLAAFAALGIVATAAMGSIGRGDWQLAILLYAVATIGFSASNQFYDALLVDVAAPSRYHQVSGLGYGLGYLGGGLLFAFNVWMTLQPQRFGLLDATEGALASFATVAAWWALFSIPLLRYVHEPLRPASTTGWAAVIASVREIAVTLRAIRALRPMVLFLVAYWLYIDGVGTIAQMALDYGIALGLDERSLILALLITQFVGFPAAIAFGHLGARIGPKSGIGIGLAVYVMAVVWSYFMRSAWEFYVLASVVGLVQGGVQSLSRSLFAELVPRDQAAEFFGFYNMLGKFAAIVGPLLIGVTAYATRNPRLGVLSVAVLFIAGGAVLWFVDEHEGERIAKRWRTH